MVYTGVLSRYRYETIIEIGKALKKIDSKIELDIYSQTVLTDEMKKELDIYPNLKFNGRIDREQVDIAQKESDILLHVEGFNEEAIHSSKMSFSTKIIDYMLKGKIIFAIGSEKINSIQVLDKNNLAVVAKKQEEINIKLKQIVNQEIDFDKILSSVENYLKTERNIEVIRREIKKRMEGLLNESSAN